MLKLFFSVLTLSCIICVDNVQAEDCQEVCREEGKTCMKVCVDIFRHERKCGELCQYLEHTCIQACFKTVCEEQCDKTSKTSHDAKKCKERCGYNGKSWLENPLLR